MAIFIAGVFYYAGHGFEFGGDSYMMPIDCRTGITDPHESLCVKHLVSAMENCEPALCTLFLDMCRQTNAPPAHCLHCNQSQVALWWLF